MVKRWMLGLGALVLMLTLISGIAAPVAGAQSGTAIDSDSDGLSDVDEATWGTDPAHSDTDGDGLTDSDEAFMYDSDPLKLDSDSDGFDDGVEVNMGSNPADLLSTPDSPSSGSSIEIDAYFCQNGFGLAGECDLAPNVTFELTDQSGQVDDEQTTNGIGRTYFYNVAPDTYTISRLSFDVPLPNQVTCLDATTGAPIEVSVVRTNSVDVAVLSVAADQPVQCDWFFDASDDVAPAGDIGAFVYLCEPGFVAETYDDYYDACLDTGDGVSLFLTDVTTGEVSETVTNGDGLGTFNGLPNGSYSLELGVPGDFASFGVACFIGAGKDPAFLVEDENIVNLAVQGNYQYCQWYVVPEPQNGSATGEIGVEVLLCPEDYDGPDFDVYCDDPLEGVGLFLTADGSDDTIEGETGVDGREFFIQLPNGAYTLELGVPGDFADSIYITCFITGGEQPDPIGGQFTNQFDIDVVDGRTYGCTWYVTLSDAGAEPSPSAQPTAKPTAQPTAKPSTGGVTTLPATGVGQGATLDGNVIAVLAVVMMASVAGFALTTRRAFR